MEAGSTIPIPIEYFITTTSDWTAFQIIEGGWWSNVEVKCLEGCGRIMKNSLRYTDNSISISKRQFDRSKVTIHLKCTLNIIRTYVNSAIVYLITKGLIEETGIRAVIAGSEEHTMQNYVHNSSDWRNPFYVNVPAIEYINALQRRTTTQKIVTEPKEERQHPIIANFNNSFEKVLRKRKPTKIDVEDVFGWLSSVGENAHKRIEAELCRDLTLSAQTYFLRFSNLKKVLNKQAKQTLARITKRYDELRQIEGKFAVKIPYVGVEKEQKKISPDK